MTSINSEYESIVSSGFSSEESMVSSGSSSNNIRISRNGSSTREVGTNPRFTLLELSRLKNPLNISNSPLVIKPLLRQTSSAPSSSLNDSNATSSSPTSSIQSSPFFSSNDLQASSNPDSPQIMPNEFKINLNADSQAGTSTSFRNQIFNNINEKITSHINEHVDLINSKSNFTQDKSKFVVGKYILIESPNESFNLAFHTETNEQFFWKKFDQRDHMKKLEPYLIMEGSERIYRYCNLINKPNDQFVYVLFEPHYGDLHTYMKCKKRLNETEAKFIFKQCVEAVDDCHQNGIIVRDIKLKKFVFLNLER